MSEGIKRSDIDDYGKRNSNKDSYKNRQFKGKRTTVDEYTGETLYYSKNGVNKKSFDSRHYTPSKTANVDHIVTIDQMKKKYGNEISKEQLKRITNSDYNLAITSEALNKSKLGRSNHEYLLDQLKNKNPKSINTSYNMIKKEITANVAICTDVQVTKFTETAGRILNVDNVGMKNTASTVGNLAGNAVYSGTSAAFVSLTVSSINNIALVAAGEKEIDDALKDLARDTSGSFISGAGLDLTQYAISQVVKHGNDNGLVTLLSKDLPIAELSTMIMVGNSVVKFINDDISAEECVTEIIMNGAGMLAYQLGMVTGGPAGAVIASIIVGQISKTVLEYKQIKKINAAKEAQINTLVREATIEMEHQRQKLKNMVDDELRQWDVAFNNGYEKIYGATLENDVEGISNGIDIILSVFNKKCKFSTLDEFNDFFDDTDSILTL